MWAAPTEPKRKSAPFARLPRAGERRKECGTRKFEARRSDPTCNGGMWGTRLRPYAKGKSGSGIEPQVAGSGTRLGRSTLGHYTNVVDVNFEARHEEPTY